MNTLYRGFGTNSLKDCWLLKYFSLKFNFVNKKVNKSLKKMIGEIHDQVI